MKASETQRLFVGLGKKDNYEKEKLRAYLSNKSGIAEGAFLDTFVLDAFSFVTLSPEDAEILLAVFKKETVNGRSLLSKAKDRDGGGSNRSESRGGNERSGGGRSFNRSSSSSSSSSDRKFSGNRSGGSGRRSDSPSFAGGKQQRKRNYNN
jgi:hypothetical protein